MHLFHKWSEWMVETVQPAFSGCSYMRDDYKLLRVCTCGKEQRKWAYS